MNTMVDDAELLLRYAQKKSEAAFAELVRRHVDLVYSAALRRVGGDAHAAADVTQQVFVGLARRAGSLGRGTVLPAWLYATTRNVAVDFVRAEHRRRARERESLMSGLNHAPEETADWEQLRPLLDAAMDELGERDREAVVLRYFARQPFAEIGRGLGLSEDAARMRVERALEKLRARLGRRGVTSTAAGIALALSNEAVAAAPAGLAVSVASSATTAAGAALSPAMVLLQFMSTSKIVMSSAAVAVVLALGTAVQEGLAIRETAAARAGVERKMAAMRARIADANWSAQTAEAEAARLAAGRAARPPEAARSFPARAASSTAAGDAFIARHPEVQQLAREYRRTQIAGSYAALFKLLRLTPAQIERFKDLASKGTSESFTGANGELVRYSSASEGEWEQAEAELRAMLGEDGYTLYRNYYEVLGPAWQMTTQFAGDLFSSPTPLSAPQAEQLQRVLTAGRVATEWSRRPQYDWPAIMAQAQAFLSPEQLAVLRDRSAHDRFSQAMSRARAAGELK